MASQDQQSLTTEPPQNRLVGSAARVAILVPVYFPYRWIAPFMRRCLEDFWPGHPPIFFCGLQPEEAPDLPVDQLLPLRDPRLPRPWCGFVRDAAVALQERSFDHVYLLLEEHLPLAPCHAAHLNFTLPALLAELRGVYLGLMGWDNRRYTTRAPVLGREAGHCMHLVGASAPRFHLHPSLWQLEALRGCLELTLRETDPTPWRFEKVNERATADLPEVWKSGCYQIAGRALAFPPERGLTKIARRMEDALLHKIMAFYPLLPDGPIRPAFWRTFGFDRFFYRGPYPMFFSGVMAKGGLNADFALYVQRHPALQPLWTSLLAAKSRAESTPTFSP